MSGKAVGKAFDIEGLSPTEKFVLVAYADHASHDGSNIYPAINSVAKKTGLSRRSVQRATKTLETMGILIPDGTGPNGTNRWCLDMGYEFEGVSESHPVTESPVTESHEGVTDSPKRGDTESPKPLINRLINRHNHKEAIISESTLQIEEILQTWGELFPDKPQPRNSTKSLMDKLRTRLKSEHFRENWHEALVRASQSPTLQGESWFDFRFFVRNDENYQKCLDEWMAWKDQRLIAKNKSRNLPEGV